MPVVLYDSGFWKRVVNFEALAEYGMISPEDLTRFRIVDSAQDIWSALLDMGLEA